MDDDHHNKARDSFTTDTTDSEKSPTSVNGDSVVDGNRRLQNSDVLENKVKKVKRHWSWSKSDFRLDFSSKLGKIRMNKKPLAETSDDIAFAINVSPTKKKQWPFKGKNVPKKVYPMPPKQNLSPRKESAQFYVPTVNIDGSLASPPHHLAHLDFDVDSESISDNYAAQLTTITSSQDTLCTSTSVSTISTTTAITSATTTATTASSTAVVTSAVQTAMKKSRRISSGSIVSRPKTAPPAPPISSIKFPSISQGSNISQPQALGSSCSDVTVDQEPTQSGSSLSRVGSLSLGLCKFVVVKITLEF